MLDLGLYLLYALVAIGVLGAVVFSVITALNTSGSLMKSMIGIGALLVIFVISYLLSSDDVSTKNQALGVTSTGAKTIGAGLIMFYITFFTAIAGLIFSEINKALK